MKLSPTFIAAVAFVSGFTRAEVPTAVAIALAESGGDNAAVHHNSDGTTDTGLWQINSSNADIINKYKKYGGITSPIANGEMAYAVYQRQGWDAWHTYTSGAYRQFMTKGASGEKAAQPNPMKIALGDPSKWVINGQVPNGSGENGLDNPNTTGVSIPGMPNLSGITSALGTLTSGSTWLRIGAIVGAVLLVLVGVVFMIESDKNVRSVTEVAAMA